MYLNNDGKMEFAKSILKMVLDAFYLLIYRKHLLNFGIPILNSNFISNRYLQTIVL